MGKKATNKVRDAVLTMKSSIFQDPTSCLHRDLFYVVYTTIEGVADIRMLAITLNSLSAVGK